MEIKMAKNYIFSTLANDQIYTNWHKGGNEIPQRGHSVLIKGGTGVANDRLITPLGVSTEVTDFDIEELRKNPSFLDHEKYGFVTIKTKKMEEEKVAADMNLKDQSAPLTAAHYVNNGNVEDLRVKTNSL